MLKHFKNQKTKNLLPLLGLDLPDITRMKKKNEKKAH